MNLMKCGLALILVMQCNVLQVLGQRSAKGARMQGASANQPLNVVLLIGDGMGLSQVSAVYYYGKGTPNFSRFQHIGLMNTSSASDKVTDSGAGATAFATGVRTYNGAVGVGPDSLPRTNLIELAQAKGVKSGLVATSSLTHATPAAFYAHVADRDSTQDIALQLVRARIDFLAGSGWQYLSQRHDSLNLLDTLVHMGYAIDTTRLRPLRALRRQEKAAYLLAPKHLPGAPSGRGDFLPAATQLALEFLQGRNRGQGFFLMVEGAQIDWGGHANDAEFVVQEMLDFDETIGVALDFAQRHGNTLVLVTGDHETGGFTLAATKDAYGSKHASATDEIDMRFSTEGHSATLVPVFAYGPGASAFTGVYNNTEIFQRIVRLMGWKSH